jgi:nicotinamide mononucleotide (NMN) deamidase PncC
MNGNHSIVWGDRLTQTALNESPTAGIFAKNLDPQSGNTRIFSGIICY